MRKCDKWNDFAAIKLRLSSPKRCYSRFVAPLRTSPIDTVCKQGVVSISTTAPVA